MLDAEDNPQVTDPPDDTGGGSQSPEAEPQATDPPDDTGGGGSTEVKSE